MGLEVQEQRQLVQRQELERKHQDQLRELHLKRCELERKLELSLRDLNRGLRESDLEKKELDMQIEMEKILLDSPCEKELPSTSSQVIECELHHSGERGEGRTAPIEKWIAGRNGPPLQCAAA